MAEKRHIFKMTPEAKVGLFVLIGLVLLVYMSLRLGGIQFGRAEGYVLYVDFDSAAGLDKNASVRVAGVEVGRIKDITLKNNKARLTLEIKPDVKVGKDFTAVLTTKGLLGEKYLELVPGSPGAPPLKDGEEITRTTHYVDIDRLLTILSNVSQDIKGVTDSLNKVLGGEEGERTLRNIVRNIEDISVKFKRIIDKNDEQLTQILANLDSFTENLREQGPGITSELKTAARNLNEALLKTSNNLNSMIEDNRGNLKDGVENLKTASASLRQAMDTINKVTREVGPGLANTTNSVASITRKIDKGEGTIGMLINDPTLHDNINKTVTGITNYIDKAEKFRLFVGYRGEYLSEVSDAKNYFSLRVQPKADKYYLLEIVDDPRGKVETEKVETTVGGATTTTDKVTTYDKLKFSAQIAKRIKNFTVRGGVIESTGGAGVDYNLMKDRLKFSLDAFDFGAKGNPRLKATARVNFSKYFHLTAGYDDFISRRGLRSPFLGIGFEFEDEDLKYLIGSAPVSSIAK